MGKRKRYTDEFRADGVLTLEAAGYPGKKGALTKVANRLGMPYQTLSRWFWEQRNPPPPEMVQEKRGDLVTAMIGEIWGIIDEMPAARKDADLRALGTVLGILTDKVQLLTGEPTERQQQRVIIERRGIDTLPTHLASGPNKDTVRA
jgi:hypothetical protein